MRIMRKSIVAIINTVIEFLRLILGILFFHLIQMEVKPNSLPMIMIMIGINGSM